MTVRLLMRRLTRLCWKLFISLGDLVQTKPDKRTADESGSSYRGGGGGQNNWFFTSTLGSLTRSELALPSGAALERKADGPRLTKSVSTHLSIPTVIRTSHGHCPVALPAHNY